MTQTASLDPDAFVSTLVRLRQSRRFTERPVPREVLETLLEVARWTGSAKNSQPWHLIVVEDKPMLRHLATCGAFAGFLDNVAVALVIALDDSSPRSTAYDAGRLSERVMLAADVLGYGSGTAWFGTDENQDQVRQALGVPASIQVWSAIGLGVTESTAEQRPGGVQGGRKPLDEIVSWERFGQPAN